MKEFSGPFALCLRLGSPHEKAGDKSLWATEVSSREAESRRVTAQAWSGAGKGWTRPRGCVGVMETF